MTSDAVPPPPAPAPDAPTRADRYVIDDVAQLDALASPTRLEIAQVLEGEGAMSVAEIAAELGRAPDGLYFHLKRLTEVGLIFECDVVATNGHTVRGYMAIADRIITPYRPDDPDAIDALERTVGASMRLTERDVLAALRAGDAVTAGPARDTFLARMKGWVTPEEHARVNELIQDVITIVNRHRRGPGRHQLTVTLGVSRGAPRDPAAPPE